MTHALITHQSSVITRLAHRFVHFSICPSICPSSHVTAPQHEKCFSKFLCPRIILNFKQSQFPYHKLVRINSRAFQMLFEGIEIFSRRQMPFHVLPITSKATKISSKFLSREDHKFQVKWASIPIDSKLWSNFSLLFKSFACAVCRTFCANPNDQQNCNIFYDLIPSVFCIKNSLPSFTNKIWHAWDFVLTMLTMKFFA